MIQRLSHSVIYVLDQDAAYDFYINKLGFEVRTDHTMPGLRWLTVGPKGQPDLEIVDAVVARTAHAGRDRQDAARPGEPAMGSGVFQTPDCRKTYEELKSKGVEFKQEPTDRFYGVDVVFRDNSGNWFSLTQPKDWKAPA